MFEIVAGAVALVVTFGLTFFGVLFLHKTKVALCTRPFPGPELAAKRCQAPCEWCDHMEAWNASDGRTGPSTGPYRNPAADLQQGPPEVQAAPYFVAEDLRCLRDVLSIKYVLKLFQENRRRASLEMSVSVSSGIVDHGEGSDESGR